MIWNSILTGNAWNFYDFLALQRKIYWNRPINRWLHWWFRRHAAKCIFGPESCNFLVKTVFWTWISWNSLKIRIVATWAARENLTVDSGRKVHTRMKKVTVLNSRNHWWRDESLELGKENIKLGRNLLSCIINHTQETIPPPKMCKSAKCTKPL